jgi:hypothetical protein
MQYVGRMPLAKDYGRLGLYHVSSPAEPASGAAGEAPRGVVSAGQRDASAQ